MVALPKRDRLAERREATRQEIVEAAWAIARASSIAAVTLREIADRIGMRPPSLYTHFPSKNAVYDAMFEQAWSDYLDVARDAYQGLDDEPRLALRAAAHTFFDFAVADLARHQLMNQRTIPEFVPSAAAYQPAIEALEMFGALLARIGLPEEADRDLCVALIGGLVDAQLANDPGGTRWAQLIDRAVDMLADETGLPGERVTRRPPDRQIGVRRPPQATTNLTTKPRSHP
jgi:AcrR family transcriptional regulator